MTRPSFFALRCPAAVLALLAVTAVAARPAAAQRTDSSRIGAAPPVTAPRDTLGLHPLPAGIKPPVTPRRAFLYSLLLPGLGQSVLDRPNAGALFAGFELLSIAMLRNAQFDLREARRLQNDSIVVGWVADTTAAGMHPQLVASRYDVGRVHARRTHVEDWIAALVFNHLLAGADAFVAAQLWDLPTQVSARATHDGVALSADVIFR